ncbi:hypothetical protein N7481_007114 [Penicillium waksmanii]|uniref:uncharacterized protein n=1 Tax=Penicillium waksmanii TaxID=69791 RepID=UPI00254923BD|nr:uncharacterized protein N7481_007114 [Penicillium waksmanii]KAJ5979816.1 hypothetical protein N7481_007114 [Penicillium waksmanii]
MGTSTTTQDSTMSESPPPPTTFREGGYGWVCVACTFLMNAHTWGINAAYGVFLSYYLSSDIFPGTSSLEYAFVGGLSISCAMLIAPLATYLDKRISTRFVLNLGAVLETLSFIASSFAKKSWQLFLAQGACFGFGMGLCFCGSVGITSHWFEKKRSLVNGIGSAGSGIGGLIYSLAVGKMIPELGLPWSMRTLGIICFVVNIPCANLLRVPSQKRSATSVKAPTFPLSLFKRLDFALLLAWAFLSALAYVTLLFSLSSYCVAIGLTQQQGSLASALLSLGQAFGRPAVGLLSDHFGRIFISMIASFLAGLLSLVIWIFASSAGLTYFFAIIVGLFAGTLWASAAPPCRGDCGNSTSRDCAGGYLLRNEVGSSKPYLRVQLFAGFVYVGSAACLAWLLIEVRRKRRVARLETDKSDL